MNPDYGRLAEEFRLGVIAHVAIYPEFWTKFLDVRNRKFTRTTSVSKDKLRKICSFVLTHPLKDSTKIKLAYFINPSREAVFEIATDVVRKYGDPIVRELRGDYLKRVVHPLLDQWNGFLIKVASTDKFAPAYISFEDKLTYAVIGFLRAVHKFDFESNKSLSTVAYQWIKDTVTTGIFKERSAVYVPHDIKVKAVAKSKEAVEKVAAALNGFSLDNVVFDDKRLIDFQGVEDTAYKETEATEHLKYLLRSHLTPTEYTIITKKFGLFGQKAESDSQLARELKMSYKKLKNHVKTIINKLRDIPDLQSTLYELVGG